MSFNYSSIINGDLSSDNPLFWSLPTPLNCSTVRVIGIYLCLCGLAGVFLNGSLLISFSRYKSLRTPPNIFIIFIAGGGFIASCINLPLTGSSSIFCRWLYTRIGCQMDGFIAFLNGCSSCYLLCTVSLSRCYIIVRPFHAKNVTVMQSTIVSCVAVLLALIVTLLPFLGWNEYTLEGARTACCTNLYDRRALYVSYNSFIFILVYCVPLIILVTTNTIIYIGLKRMGEKVAHGIKTEFSQKRIQMERRVLKSIVITILGFLTTWTPYTITFFISAFSGSGKGASPMATFVCSCFAKSSVVWIPLLYINTSTQFRFSLVDSNALEKLGGTTSGPNEASMEVAAVHQTQNNRNTRD